MDTRSVLRPSHTHYFLSVTTSALSFGLGGAILGGGEARFSVPSLLVARTLAGPTWWGGVLLLAGLLLAFGIATDSIRARRIAFAAIAAWAFFFAGTIGVSASRDAKSPWTGVFAYTWVGLVSIVLSRTDVGQLKSRE